MNNNMKMRTKYLFRILAAPQISQPERPYTYAKRLKQQNYNKLWSRNMCDKSANRQL